MRSWKTTLCGVLAAICTTLSTVSGMESYKEILIGLAAIFTALLGVFGKDSNVSGPKTHTPE